MIATILIACTVGLLLILTWRLTRATSAGSDPFQVWDIQGQKVPVDAFRLLVDSDEAAYLWKSVPEAEFRRLQRKRIALAWRHVHTMANNAALLMRVAMLARQEGDSEIASVADQLMFLCYRVRVSALVAEAYLLLKWIFPGLAFRLPIALARYERLIQDCDWILARRQRLSAQVRTAA